MACGLFSLRTIRLLTKIWRIFAFKLFRPWNIFWRMWMRKWPSGALTKAPYMAIFGILDVKYVPFLLRSWAIHDARNSCKPPRVPEVSIFVRMGFFCSWLRYAYLDETRISIARSCLERPR
jgi:hypothetical protein